MSADTVPNVIADEDGDRWWIPGHVTDEAARLALLAHMLHPEWGYDDWQESYETALTVTVRRHFYKPASDTPDDERMVACAMGDPLAEPFTVLTANDEPADRPGGEAVSDVCPVHGEPWVKPDCPDGHRRCTFFVPELGASEDYGCPQVDRAEPLELEDVDDTATDDYPLPDYAQAEAEPW